MYISRGRCKIHVCDSCGREISHGNYCCRCSYEKAHLGTAVYNRVDYLRGGSHV